MSSLAGQCFAQDFSSRSKLSGTVWQYIDPSLKTPCLSQAGLQWQMESELLLWNCRSGARVTAGPVLADIAAWSVIIYDCPTVRPGKPSSLSLSCQLANLSLTQADRQGKLRVQIVQADCKRSMPTWNATNVHHQLTRESFQRVHFKPDFQTLLRLA